MNVDEFDFDLPQGQIAQYPAPRGTSRLLVLPRDDRRISHGPFSALPAWLKAGDLLILNDTRVMRARLRGRRRGGGQVEVLLLRREASDAGDAAESWTCLAYPGRRLRTGESAALDGGIVATWLDGGENGTRRVRLEAPRPIIDLLETFGEVPLPPYIARAAKVSDRQDYQTVYAGPFGAVAAPTAGLHFTHELLDRIRSSGVEIAFLTLHVGPGTFLPVRTETVDQHPMTSEHVEIPEHTAARVCRAKKDGRRVVAIGTTTVRALEGVAPALLDGRGSSTDVSLFILPGHRFAIVDALVTNFHLPRSTLLMLVAAFAGRERILAAYREAVALGYRFYSYGDAMLIV